METTNWITASASVIGSSHVAEGLPCQDSHKVELVVGTNFIIAAVSDGAGSCQNSQIGSKFQVEKSVEKLASILKLKGWFESDFNYSNLEDWKSISLNIFKEVKKELIELSVESNIEFKSLSATLIVSVTNGDFIACANVGDGRAAFRNENGDWVAMMIPTKGEEANQTIFLTSELWEDSASLYFGNSIFHEKVTAFSLMSDGCERSSFEILKYIENEDRYYDPNKPFKPFFEPIYSNLIKMHQSGLSSEKINNLWETFLTNGTDKLSSETDDKTMILSVEHSPKNVTEI